MQNEPPAPNSDISAQSQISFSVPPNVAELLSEWWFWWRGYRVGKQVIAKALRTLDRSGRWYLRIEVTPGPNAKSSRKIILRRATPGSSTWRYVKHRLIIWVRWEEPTFSFRFRFNRCPQVTVNIDSPEFILAQPSANQAVTLASADRETPIEKALILVLKSDGWPTEESAFENGQRFSNALRRSFAKFSLGANYGEFGPKGVITKSGEVFFGEQFGERVLNDVHGLMVYQSLPEPRFGKTGATPLLGKPPARLIEAFDAAVAAGKEFDEHEKSAFDLFNASFFQETLNTRFILLVMAVEALLESELRSSNVKKHIRSLMDQTTASQQLSDDERQALLGPLGRLIRESVKQSGRRFSEERLGRREYDGQPASDFFARCYDMRSSMVHGQEDPKVSREVARIVDTLKNFVSDILAAPLERDKE